MRKPVDARVREEGHNRFLVHRLGDVHAAVFLFVFLSGRLLAVDLLFQGFGNRAVRLLLRREDRDGVS